MPQEIYYIAAGAFCGGFVNGLAGFGTSLFALGWFLQALGPLEAVSLSILLSVFSGIPGVIEVRRDIVPRRLAVFVIPALLGIPFGLYLLNHINAHQLKLGIAVFLITYGIFFFSRSRMPQITFQSGLADGAVGWIGGMLGSLAGLSGAIPTIWISLKPLNKLEQRGLLQPFNVVILTVAGLLLLGTGGYSWMSWMVIATALPSTAFGAALGILLFRQLTNDQFKRLVILLTTISGIIILTTAIV